MPEPKEEDTIDVSPVPIKDVPPKIEDMPICLRCKMRIEKIRWMDYGNEVRIIIHDPCMGQIGVIKI